jgi:hypothetical protein
MRNLLFGMAAAIAVIAFSPAIDVGPFSTTAAFAKHGADDPAGDVRRGNDDAPGHTMIEVQEPLLLLARRGADDAPGDVRQGRGRDDGPNHT